MAEDMAGGGAADCRTPSQQLQWTDRFSSSLAHAAAMRDLTGKRVLITGGASGIGRALAARFAAERAHLVLLDRDARALERAVAELRAGGATVQGHVVDVTDDDSVLRARDAVRAEGGPIDVLVNNAGVVFGGPFLEVPLERHLATYRVNVLGTVAMTHAFLPDLIGRPEAHLVQVASASGFVGVPFGATYASSKWAAIGFAESLRLELAELGHRHVHVTTVCPSYVSTGLFAGARAPLLSRMITAERVATEVLRAVRSDRAFVRTPWLVEVTPFLRGVLPLRIFDAATKLLGVTSSMAEWRGRAEPEAKAARRRRAQS
jgi:all-trans-retinol dehydrogenase (NAD+)